MSWPFLLTLSFSPLYFDLNDFLKWIIQKIQTHHNKTYAFLGSNNVAKSRKGYTLYSHRRIYQYNEEHFRYHF